jgi:hypothetical protein
MAAFWTFVRDQPILVDHWSDGHHIFHRSPAFGARRNCVLASGSWFRCHNTRLLLVLPILEQRRACSLVRRKGQSTLGERDRSSAGEGELDSVRLRTYALIDVVPTALRQAS